MSTETPTAPRVAVDHETEAAIDQLIPPSRPGWMRLGVSVLILGLVVVIGWAWHFGHVRPAPDCCGSGGGSVPMVRSADGESVTVLAYFFNSSSVDLTMSDARVDLPGAQLIDVAPMPDSEGWTMPPDRLDAFPIIVPAHQDRQIAITFRPESCAPQPEGWGTATLDLKIANAWYPTVTRSFALPEPLVSQAMNDLSVLPSADDDESLQYMTEPLVAACALLGITN
jgi:hypothetical protein